MFRLADQYQLPFQKPLMSIFSLSFDGANYRSGVGWGWGLGGGGGGGGRGEGGLQKEKRRERE